MFLGSLPYREQYVNHGLLCYPRVVQVQQRRPH